MATSIFNLGTAVGTGLTGALLATRMDELAGPLIEVVFRRHRLHPLGTLATLERRTPSPYTG